MRKSKSSVLASGGWLLLNLLCLALGGGWGGVAGRVGTFIYHRDQSTLVCDKGDVRAISVPSEGGTGQ